VKRSEHPELVTDLVLGFVLGVDSKSISLAKVASALKFDAPGEEGTRGASLRVPCTAAQSPLLLILYEVHIGKFVISCENFK
jgi:hypothetical protein